MSQVPQRRVMRDIKAVVCAVIGLRIKRAQVEGSICVSFFCFDKERLWKEKTQAHHCGWENSFVDELLLF